MKLFYRETGRGRPVVILHGLFGMSDNWMTFAKRLAPDFHLYIPDLRNHGRSPHDSIMTYTAMAADVDAFIRDVVGGPCDVVGHSMGGKVAMTLALNAPERVRSLVSVDIVPKRYVSSQFKDFLRVMMQMDVAQFTTRRQADSLLEERLHIPMAVRQFLLKNLYRTEDNHFAWRPNLNALAENLDHLLDGISGTAMFEKPAMFARGTESSYISSADLPLVRENFPQAVIVDIPGANHWVHSSAPDPLENALRRFWQQ